MQGLTIPERPGEPAFPAVNISPAFPVCGLQAGAALLSDCQPDRWFYPVACIGRNRVCRTGEAVIDQTKIGTGYGFHEVFSMDYKTHCVVY